MRAEQKSQVRQAVRAVFSKIAPPRLEERTENTYEAGFKAGIEAAAYAVPDAFLAAFPYIGEKAAKLKEGGNGQD